MPDVVRADGLGERLVQRLQVHGRRPRPVDHGKFGQTHRVIEARTEPLPPGQSRRASLRRADVFMAPVASARRGADRARARGSRRRRRTRRARCPHRPARRPRRAITTTPASRSRNRATSSDGFPNPRTSTITNRPPSGTSGSTPGMPRKPFDDPIAPALVLRRHPPHALLIRRQGTGRGILHERRRPAARLLQDQQHRPDDLLGPGAVADAPAGHRIGLREAVDHDRPLAGVGGDRGRRDVPAAVVDQRLVDLVAEDRTIVLLRRTP